MNQYLPRLLFLAGLGQLSVLVAAALVPLRLQWRSSLQSLPRLHRQMYWVYGGYTAMSIIALGLITATNPEELAGGTLLARSFCLYAALFWGVRLCLVPVFDVQEHLTALWLTAGYWLLAVLFACFTVVFTWAAIHPAR
ncbi:MAG: hypothetical protein AB7O59_10325 [Pirellulales bacterium]